MASNLQSACTYLDYANLNLTACKKQEERTDSTAIGEINDKQG